MVSMAPNTQHYNFTYKWTDVCRDKREKTVGNFRLGSTMDVLSRDGRFDKFVKIIKQAHLDRWFENPTYDNTHTLFVTTDDQIPLNFLNSLDHYKARKFVQSYTLKGVADIQYMLANGDTVYFPECPENPIIAVVQVTKGTVIKETPQRINKRVPYLEGSIVINKVGKVLREIKTNNGVIIILDGLANVDTVST